MHAHDAHHAERRRRRSSRPLTALGYQLEDTARDVDIHALVLADRDGLVIAGGGPDDGDGHHDRVASLCPLVVKEGGNSYDGRLDVPEDRELSVLMFSYKGQTLYLGALLDSGNVHATRAMLHAMDGVLRILG